MAPKTLTEALARHAVLSLQGELLCTAGLGFVLSDPVASEALRRLLADRTGTELPGPIEWETESRVDTVSARLEWENLDSARIDLVGRHDGDAVIAIEGKLGATFGDGQLSTYARHLAESPRGTSVLVALVPNDRVAKITTSTSDDPSILGHGHRVRFVVVSWDELFDTVRSATTGMTLDNVTQLEGLYRGLMETEIAPIAEGDAQHWRLTTGQWHRRVAAATLKLSAHQERTNPIVPGEEFWCRYICHPVEGSQVCYGFGVRDPFAQFPETPLLMRYHSGTGHFRRIRRAVDALALPHVVSFGHIWIPVPVPVGEDPDETIASLVSFIQDTDSRIRIAL